ncbi:MAG TPA: DNA translocase FtsK 4TM domain-containing protein, partial [Bacteroidia bacterium]|nr:DNA translocase FtsK 4TM domain-containing protein [Bacteroidia bacterium]
MPKRYKKPAEESKNQIEDVKPEPAKKAKVKPSSSPDRVRKPLFAGLKANMVKWKVAPISGLFLILFSFCILLAFTSFLFTWQLDDATISSSARPEKMANWLGFVGAKLSDFFINSGFGVASFGFSLLFFLTGVKLLTSRSLLPLGKTFRITLFFIIWVSVCLGFVFHTDHLFVGGEVGLLCSDKMITLIGKSGTVIALSFVGLVFLVVNNLMTFKFAAKTPKTEEEIDEEKVDQETQPSPEAVKPVEVPKNTLVEPEEKIESFNTIEFAVESPVLKEAKKEKEEVKKADALEFTIEKTPEVIIPDETGEPKISDSPYDSTLDLSSYKFPPISLLPDFGKDEVIIDAEELTANKDRIVSTLRHYGIEIKKIKATPGPTVTLYEIVPQDGTRISKIKNLEDDIALSLAALGIRIIAPIPGKGTIGIEVPNRNKETVAMRSMLASEKFQNTTMDLPIA